MPPPIRAGLVLGFSVAAWTFVMGFTGWYRHPSLLRLFWLVVPMQVGILVWGLRTTARDSSYLRQVMNGLNATILGAMIIFTGSLLFTTVVFPTYFADLEALGRDLMAKQGLSAAQIEAAVKAQAPMQTPRASAMAGAIGTVLTGFLTSLIAAAFLRRKGAPQRISHP